MSGISSVLNIAKQAILAHQVSIQVGGHNIANVDTPGYTRQSLNLTSAQPSPSTLGPIGNGVNAEYIFRHYDRFMTNRIMNQNSTLNNLEGQQETLRMLQTAFNEAPGLAINELMSEFWGSWQTLADNPEMLANRQMTVQQAELIISKLNSMEAEVAQTRYDIGASITSAVEEINSLTSQIAQMNVEITSSESDKQKANDLRDFRDELLKSLSELVDVNYFETTSGAYTVMLPTGHPLVDTDSNWEVDWLDDKLLWTSERRNTLNQVETTTQTIASGADVGGRIGGLMETFGTIVTGRPANFIGRLNAFANSLIREINQQHSQGVGLTRFSGELTGTASAADTGRLTTTVLATSATTTVESGVININDLTIGKISGGTAVNGRAKIKAYNAVTAINNAFTGVKAKLTTQAAGDAVTPMAAGDDGAVLTFTINGVSVSYTVDTDGVLPAQDDDTAANLADHLVTAINNAITAYNTAAPANVPKVNITAVVGDGANGGALNSIVLQNTNDGDETQIVVAGISSATVEANLGFPADTTTTYTADATNNTGEITLFSEDPFTVAAGVDDNVLDQFGWGGGALSSTDEASDGKFTYTYADGGLQYSLQGYRYSDDLVTDGGSFDLWIYNTDGTLALAQPVNVPLDGVYDLQDVVDAINDSITNASNQAAPWGVRASISNNQLVFTADSNHEFAFANDTSNLLQVAGINTFFTGYDAGSIGINEVIKNDINKIAAATVTQYGEIFRGDNSNALLITDIQRDVEVTFQGSVNNSLDGFYNSLVGDVGIKGNSVDHDLEFNQILADQMKELRDSVSGVSLDEEMANLIKYQHAFSAAAKLISVSDEMLLTLLETV